MVLSTTATEIMFFFALRVAFSMASGTSFALPVPTPILPAPSPTMTSAAKRIFLPPFTVLETRFTSISFLMSPSSSACLL